MVINEVSVPTDAMFCSMIGLRDWSIGPKRPGGARGIKASCPGRSATLIENQGPSIESLVCFDHIVTAASGLLFLRGFSRVNSLPTDRDLLQRRRLSDKWVHGSRSQISVESILAPIRKSRRSSPYSAKYLLIIRREMPRMNGPNLLILKQNA